MISLNCDFTKFRFKLQFHSLRRFKRKTLPDDEHQCGSKGVRSFGALLNLLLKLLQFWRTIALIFEIITVLAHNCTNYWNYYSFGAQLHLLLKLLQFWRTIEPFIEIITVLVHNWTFYWNYYSFGAQLDLLLKLLQFWCTIAPNYYWNYYSFGAQLHLLLKLLQFCAQLNLLLKLLQFRCTIEPFIEIITVLVHNWTLYWNYYSFGAQLH